MEDSELLQICTTEETRNQGFTLLIQQYQKRVYYHIRKIVIDHDDANDLTQETFIKVWHNIDAFRAEAKLYTWLYRIATNICLDFLKKKRRRFFLPIGDIEGELTAKLESAHLIDADEVELKLQKAILRLPDKQRIVFNLRYFDEIPYQEMVEVLGGTEGSLKASYHHAAKKVEQYMLEG